MTARADTLLYAEGIAGQLLSGLTSAVQWPTHTGG